MSINGPTSAPMEMLKTSVLLLVCLFILFPVYLMLVISVKDNTQFLEAPFVPTWPFHYENYVTAWEYVGPYILRTLFVAVVSTFWAVFLGSLCAFVLAQYEFVARKLIFTFVVALMMIPGILNLIPLYVLVVHMDQGVRELGRCLSGWTGWGEDIRFLNTVWVLIVPAAAGGQVMLVYVLRTFFQSQPRSLFESAQLDGAGLFQIYYHIALPLARPIIGTMAIINAVALWNDYIWPLVVLQRDHYTLSVGLKYMESLNLIQYGPLMAGYLIASIPLVILFFFSMRLFIEGLASGAIKM
ncbi:MAG: carbohydrate ABC transporter permease [Candidatus Omnitrophica bacterium]|nr:carbohydrate ABC transporter permease [Candidatus Omnitrophota bacterium]